MKTKESNQVQLNILKDKLHRMLEDNDGVVTKEIVEVSQALDAFIIKEIKKYNYNKEKKTPLVNERC